MSPPASAAPPIEYRQDTWQRTMASQTDASVVVCDPIYEAADLSWVTLAAQTLRPGGALYAFADFHRVAETKLALDEELTFMNWLIWPNEWGGRPRNRFAQKHDDLLYYVKPGAPHQFNVADVQIPKMMVQKSFNPSGRTTKTPASVWTDLAGFSTTANERVRIDGVGVRWQKPEKLLRRILAASSSPGELVLDFFGGVATTPAVAYEMGRACVSCEQNPTVWAAGSNRLAQLGVPGFTAS